MKRGRKKDEAVEPQPEDLTPAVGGDGGWDGPTRAGSEGEIANLAAASARLDAEEHAEEDAEEATETSDTSVDALFDASSDAAAEPAEPASTSGEPAREGSEEGSVDAPADGSSEGSSEGSIDGSVDDLALEAEALAGLDASGDDAELPEPPVESPVRLESILESLLYAAERPLSVTDLKRLVNERDAKKVTAALEALRERHADTGIQLASLAGGWQFRTHPDNGPWVAKLVAGRPQRLSRAMLEALAIIAYRQPITRPEVDEIRGVDCGPVLKTLLERGFVRILGKKEDVGRPMLYGTTPEFLRTFSLRDLSELPTLREFHELSEQHLATVEAQAPLPEGAPPPVPAEPARSPFAPTPMDLTPVDQDEEEALLEELDGATLAAARASGPPPGQGAEASASEPSEAQS